MKKIKKYVPFMKAGFHQASTYKLNLIFIILGNIIGCFVSFYLWKAVFDATDTSSFMGFNMVEMTTYVFISFVTNSIIGCNAMTSIGEEIKDGTIAFRLLKPISYNLTFISQEVGEKVLKILFVFIMSFGGGDAYLTVADGMFVDSGMVTKEEFYSMLAPLTNVLPGSILCKTLSGVGYYIGIEISGSVLGGLSVALAGFAISIVASCSVISLMTGLYEAFGNLNVFSELKRWIRPIVSGLLVNVILSLIVQVKHHGAEFGAEREFIFLMMAIYLVNSLVVKKYRFRNEIIVGISIILSLALCNLLVLCR